MLFPRGGAGRVYAFALALVATVIFGGVASAQERHALVIGIDSYDNVASLAKARNDARAVAETLEETGFDTDLLIDVAGLDLLSELSRFTDQLDPGDEVVFYFAGHGVEIDGRNYLLPADVPGLGPGQELVIRRAALPVQEVIDQFNSRGVRLSLLILDACRDNPFETRGTRSLGGTRGLGQEVPPEGTFIMFSAGAGQAALDRLSEDDPNPNSVFTRVLLPRLSQPGLPLRTMVREVRSEVRQLGRTVGHEQFPAVYDQLDGAFTFLPGDRDDIGESSDAAVAAQPARDPCTAARADWAMVGENPSRFLLQAYRDMHSDCPLMAALATERLIGLEAASADGPAPSDVDVESLTNEQIDEPVQAFVASCRAEADPATVPFQALQRDAGAATIEACDTARAAMSDTDGPGYFEVLFFLARAHHASEEYGTAVALYREAAEGGNTDAMANLGFMYNSGLGVAQSSTEAVRWYRAGAEEGGANAMNNLGYMYYSGRGVAQDHAEAVRWYRASAEGGYGNGMVNLGLLLQRGHGTAQDDAGAARMFLAALESGNTWVLENSAQIAPGVLRLMQQELTQLDHYTGTLDGLSGPATLQAFQSYQDAREE